MFKQKSGHRGVFPSFGQVNCKWLKILHVNLNNTCCMRCAVLLAKVYSGWAMAAMFFDAPWHGNSAPRRWNFLRDHFNRIFGKIQLRLVLLLLVQMKVVCLPLLVGHQNCQNVYKSQKKATFLQGRHVPRERIKVPSHQCHQFEKVGRVMICQLRTVFFF